MHYKVKLKIKGRGVSTFKSESKGVALLIYDVLTKKYAEDIVFAYFSAYHKCEDCIHKTKSLNVCQKKWFPTEEDRLACSDYKEE